MNIRAMGRSPFTTTSRLLLGVALVATLAGCDESGQFNLLKNKPQSGDAEVTAQAQSVKLIERDVEAPDAFQVTDQGLWDGRPSLGGVWVAHPDVKDPERVIIRNTKTGKFVIGALFRRERENPGPIIQVSSDAAAALDMLAGAPATLNVTALRREEVPEAPVAAAAPAPGPGAEALKTAPDVAQKTLAPVGATAAAAIAAAEAKDKPAAAPQAKPATAAPKPTQVAAVAPAAAPKPRANGLSKPYLQIGIFSVEQNANNTAQAMRTAGMVPTVKKQTSQGKTFWRVLVGPATSGSERDMLLKKIKDKGFADAYAVTN